MKSPVCVVLHNTILPVSVILHNTNHLLSLSSCTTQVTSCLCHSAQHKSSLFCVIPHNTKSPVCVVLHNTILPVSVVLHNTGHILSVSSSTTQIVSCLYCPAQHNITCLGHPALYKSPIVCIVLHNTSHILSVLSCTTQIISCLCRPAQHILITVHTSVQMGHTDYCTVWTLVGTVISMFHLDTQDKQAALTMKRFLVSPSCWEMLRTIFMTKGSWNLKARFISIFSPDPSQMMAAVRLLAARLMHRASSSMSGCSGLSNNIFMAWKQSADQLISPPGWLMWSTSQLTATVTMVSQFTKTQRLDVWLLLALQHLHGQKVLSWSVSESIG